VQKITLNAMEQYKFFEILRVGPLVHNTIQTGLDLVAERILYGLIKEIC